MLVSSTDPPRSVLGIFGAHDSLTYDIVADACRAAGWYTDFGPKHETTAVLHVLKEDEDWPPSPSTDRHGEPVRHAIMCAPEKYEGDFGWRSRRRYEWINSSMPPDDIQRQMVDWLQLAPAGGRAERGLIEALFDKVQRGIVENTLLTDYVRALKAETDALRDELVDARADARTLEALLEQIESQNATLLRELSKRIVDPRSTSLIVRSLKYLVPQLVAGIVTVGATYAGTVAAMDPGSANQLQATSTVVVDHCDQIINIVGSGD